jgi:hypothetical protein
MDNTRIFKMPFAGIYPLYIRKAEKKGRTKAEADEIICRLTGYDSETLQRQIDGNVDFETFFALAPAVSPDIAKIKGVICGCRIEDMEEGTMHKIRCLDKLIDELAKGKPLDKIIGRQAG